MESRKKKEEIKRQRLEKYFLDKSALNIHSDVKV